MVTEIIPLNSSHALPLVELYQQSSTEYSQHFRPFSFDIDTLIKILCKRERDLFFVILVEGEVAGFYMLRGFDEGYAVPCYGIWIAEKYSGQGLARMTLEHAISVCKKLGSSVLMLKVHPDNIRARQLYEKFGFKQTGIDTKNNNMIFNLMLS